MAYPLIPRLDPRARRSPAPPTRPVRPSAVEAMMAADFDEEMPLGGGGGMMLPAGVPEAPAAPPQGLVFEPPPWQGREAEAILEQAAEAPAEPPPSALDTMKIADFDPPAPGPPAVVEPLQPFRPPEPDWELEQRERLPDPEPAAAPSPPLFIAPPPWK